MSVLGTAQCSLIAYRPLYCSDNSCKNNTKSVSIIYYDFVIIILISSSPLLRLFLLFQLIANVTVAVLVVLVN